jgi:hypothetical protein
MVRIPPSPPVLLRDEFPDPMALSSEVCDAQAWFGGRIPLPLNPNLGASRPCRPKVTNHLTPALTAVISTRRTPVREVGFISLCWSRMRRSFFGDPHAAISDGDHHRYWHRRMQHGGEPDTRISQARAATRAARAVFLCTAPLVGQPNAGLTGQGLRLACAEPGDQLAIFGEMLRELSERASYPLRGGRPLLVLDAADVEAAGRGPRESMAGA